MPGAVIVDGGSLEVFRANDAGQFTIPYCAPLDQLYAATWIIPLGTSYTTTYGQPGRSGGSTTSFGPPPATPGPGYARIDQLWPQASSDPEPCQGQSVDFRLPPGGGVDITWMSKPGTGPATKISGPVTGYYEILPGLPYNAGTYTPTADSSGQQVMQQLGAGGLAIVSNSSPFTCQGAAVHQTSGSSFQAQVVPGQMDQITCTVP